MSKDLNSQFKASSFCCTLNHIDKLFDLNDTSFDDQKYSDKTRKLVKEFRANLTQINHILKKILSIISFIYG